MKSARFVGLVAPALLTLAVGVGACGSNSSKATPPHQAAAPAGFCNAVKAVDTDVSNLLNSHGASPSVDQTSGLKNDAITLGEQGQAAGPPYSDEVQQLLKDQQGANTQGAVAVLDQMENQCHLPTTHV